MVTGGPVTDRSAGLSDSAIESIDSPVGSGKENRGAIEAPNMAECGLVGKLIVELLDYERRRWANPERYLGRAL
jgi:hypothetical protein